MLSHLEAPAVLKQVAGAHVIMLGCYVEYGTDSEQYAWLLQDLAGVDRGRTPWVIVAMHAPWCEPRSLFHSL